jgi:hypothetical protein
VRVHRSAAFHVPEQLAHALQTEWTAGIGSIGVRASGRVCGGARRTCAVRKHRDEQLGVEHIAVTDAPQVNRLLLTLLQVYGIQQASYGDATGNVMGPIEALLA